MNVPTTLQRRIALTLLRRTAFILPTDRQTWAQAMLSELHQMEDDREALRWSVGCVIAASKVRSNAMLIGNMKIARWVLIPEMLLCFGPLSIGWWDATFGDSGIVRLNADVVHRYSVGTAAIIRMVSSAILGLLGPIGLIVATRVAVFGRPLGRHLGTALASGSFLFVGGLLTISLTNLFTRTAIGKKFSVVIPTLVLMVALPILGVLHLRWLSAKRSVA